MKKIIALVLTVVILLAMNISLVSAASSCPLTGATSNNNAIQNLSGLRSFLSNFLSSKLAQNSKCDLTNDCVQGNECANDNNCVQNNNCVNSNGCGQDNGCAQGTGNESTNQDFLNRIYNSPFSSNCNR